MYGPFPQLLQVRKQKVTEQIIRKATSGVKEADASVFNVVHNLFTPLSKKRVKELGLTEEEDSRYVDRLSREIEGSGAMERIALGALLPSTTKFDSNVELFQDVLITTRICKYMTLRYFGT